MKNVVVTLMILTVVVLGFGCGETSKTVEVSFSVDGMTCESCSGAITDTLSKIDGVESASADHLIGSAHAVFRSPEVSLDHLVGEIEGLGYTVTATEIVKNGG